MSAKDFKFVSPGVFIEEIDNSQIPKSPVAIGPLVIGRSRKGPAYQPVRVDSFSEFVSIFGGPVGGEESSDLWRAGTPTAPTFAAYAAQAWLRNSSPLTFIRLLGDQSPDQDATTYARAGWATPLTTQASQPSRGGAYGLFLFNSASSSPEVVDGTLAAIIYATSGAPTLSGTLRQGLAGGHPDLQTTTGSCALVVSGDKNFTFQMYNSDEVLQEEAVINFERSSQNYIRKVLNSNPTKTNSALIDATAATAKNYFVGQTFEREVADKITSTGAYGLIVRLGRSGTGVVDGSEYRFASQGARSGWFFSQDLRNTPADTAIAANNTLAPKIFDPASLVGTSRLFRLHSLSAGEELQRNYKIAIEDLQYSTNDNTPYGSFTLAIRDVQDSDNAKVYVERYTGLSLDPNSENYISKQIGDRYYEWNNDARRLIEYGSYPNVSSLIRVEMSPSIDAGQENPELLPFGVEGPIKFNNFELRSLQGANDDAGAIMKPGATGITAPQSPVHASSASSTAGTFMAASSSDTPGETSQAVLVRSARGLNIAFTGTVNFPAFPLRLSASHGDLADPTEAYFGAQYSRASGSVVFEPSTYDLSYPLAAANQFGPSATAAGGLITSWYFSMDDLVAEYKTAAGNKDKLFYFSGSRAGGYSVTAISGSYKKILDMGYDRFTAPLYGGFNGFDITEAEPFNQDRALTAGGTTASETNSSMFFSVKKAIDMFADPEFIEANIITAPGIRQTGLTTQMITTCESRGDALALIDPLGGYKPSSENDDNEQTRIDTGLGKGGISQHVLNVGNGISERNLNSSYGAVYYPWVRITDTISGRNLWAPPSVAALGAMSYSENNSALWFAPAGFNRGGLTEGAAGIPVTNVRSRLTSAERDFLYERNVNPIASFPNEGIVIFGQKTLQVTPSALDRINVRRLMIFVKKEISRIASRLLFDQNVEQTWSRFTGQVNPFLTNIKNNFGLDAFKVVLDETTTTPDLIDRNTIYAKIFLKPTKAVEFFAIDFVITNSGAGFED